jgi:hypothetical protein
MALIFPANEHRDDMPLTCPSCGWTGCARDASMEMFQDLFHLECPKCPKIIAIFYFAEVKHPEPGDPGYEEWKKRRDEYENQFLKTPDQLPEVEGEELDFLWDFEKNADKEWTVIRLGQTEIWREPAIWEGCDWFEVRKEALKQKYGSRFRSLKPTDASKLYLYGDRWREADVDPY